MTLLYRLAKVTWRWKGRVFAVGLLATLLAFGPGGLARLSAPESAREYVQTQVNSLRRRDPTAAAELDRLAAGRDANALAATLRAGELRYSTSAITELSENLHGEKASVLGWYDLLSTAMRREKAMDRDRAETFAESYAPLYQLLLDLDPSSREAEAFAVLLREASEADDAVWSVVRDDPVSLMVWQAAGRRDAGLWSFYAAEREWLAPALWSVAAGIDDDGAGDGEVAGSEDASFMTSTDARASVEAALRAARRYHPGPRDILQGLATSMENSPGGRTDGPDGVDNETGQMAMGGLVLTYYVRYGEVIASVSERAKVSPLDVMEVIAVNPDEFLEVDDPAAVAAHMIQVAVNKSTVWAAARTAPFSLWLDRKVPALSESLIARYGTDGAIQAVMAAYADQVELAAAAVDRFGDVALYWLAHYRDNPEFRDMLVRLGVRVVPFFTMHGDDSFAMLNDKKALGWLDKYFDEDGREKEPGWIESMPVVGGPVTVVKNWSAGVPNTWSELGWGALDAADGVLLVMSFGSSAPATAAKQTAKQTGRRAVRGAMVNQGRAVAVRTAAQRGAQTAVRKATVRGGQQTGTTLLRRLAQAKAVRWMGTATSRATGAAVRGTRWAMGTTWHAAQTVHRSWTGLAPLTRQRFARALFAVGFYFSLQHHGPQIVNQLPAWGEQLGRSVGRFTRQSATAVANAVAAAILEGVSGWFGHPNISMLQSTVVWCVALLLVIGLMVCVCRKRPKLVRSAGGPA